MGLLKIEFGLLLTFRNLSQLVIQGNRLRLVARAAFWEGAESFSGRSVIQWGVALAMPFMCGSVSFLDHFSALEDPRQSWRVVYPLPEMLLLLCATLSGMKDFTETSLWGRERLAFLRRFLAFEGGVLSHDTLNDIVNAIDGETFKTCFSSWVETLKDADPNIIAIDSKLRGCDMVKLRMTDVMKGGKIRTRTSII